jgi:hypothetical protein
MSVKFKEEVTKTQVVNNGVAGAHGKHELLHEVGTALTKGGGPNGYLAVRTGNPNLPEGTF